MLVFPLKKQAVCKWIEWRGQFFWNNRIKIESARVRGSNKDSWRWLGLYKFTVLIGSLYMTVYEPNVLTDFECAPDAQTGVYSQIGVFWGAVRMRSSPQCAAGRSAHAQFAIVRSRVCGGASRPSRLHCLFLLSAVTIFAILLIIYCAKSRLIESNLFRSVIALNRCRSQRNALVRLKCVMRGRR